MKEIFQDLNMKLLSFFVPWQAEDPINRIDVLPEESTLIFQIKGFSDFNDYAEYAATSSSQLDPEEGRETVYVTFVFMDGVEVTKLKSEQVVKENIKSIEMSHVIASTPVAVPS